MVSQLVLLALVAIAPGCGGGGDDGGPHTLTGQFIDAPVKGLTYVTTTFKKAALTDANGGYHYVAGDYVEFSVDGMDGQILLGKCKAGRVVTPVDLVFGGGSVSNQKVLNVVTLLLSVNSSNDPRRMVIDPSLVAKIATADINFDALSADFTAALATSLGIDSSIVTDNSSQAETHLETGAYTAVIAGDYSVVGTDGKKSTLSIQTDGTTTFPDGTTGYITEVTMPTATTYLTSFYNEIDKTTPDVTITATDDGGMTCTIDGDEGTRTTKGLYIVPANN